MNPSVVVAGIVVLFVLFVVVFVSMVLVISLSASRRRGAPEDAGLDPSGRERSEG
jgi:hypothetical protein